MQHQHLHLSMCAPRIWHTPNLAEMHFEQSSLPLHFVCMHPMQFIHFLVNIGLRVVAGVNHVKPPEAFVFQRKITFPAISVCYTARCHVFLYDRNQRVCIPVSDNKQRSIHIQATAYKAK